MTRSDELSLLSADLRRANSVITELLRAGVRVLGVDLCNEVPVVECAHDPSRLPEPLSVSDDIR